MLVRVLYPSYTNPHVMHRVEGGTAHWIEVGSECLCGYDVQSVEGAAEIMFGLWNGDSGSESPRLFVLLVFVRSQRGTF